MARILRYVALVVAAALLVLGTQPAWARRAGSATAAGPASTARPAGTASPGYIENGSDNPVTAAPTPTVPATAYCSVTLADHFLSNAPDGTPQNYSGTLTPPSACAGPWTKVLLTHTISVSGRQYDRSDSLKIGSSIVYFGTTEEPGGPTPITYTFTDDITRFAALLRTPQPFTGGIGNYTSDVYTGNYDQTVTITYYRADATHPAAATADDVVGLGEDDLSTGTPSATHALSDLPRNITRAYLEVTLKGNGCDEQWFTDVPDAVAAQEGLCGGGPYREADYTLDGTPLAAVHTFPHIYSGGIVPTLWRPIVAINTFSLRPETVDITPFVGELVDGGTHQLAVSIQNLRDTWNVDANLFLYTDHGAATTSGAMVSTTTTATAPETVTTTAVPGGQRIVDTTARHDVSTGWVQTSAGRITTTVDRTMTFSNTDTVTDGGLVQALNQSDAGTQTTTTTDAAGRVTGVRHGYRYPIAVRFSAANYVDDQNFSLSATVNMTQYLADSVLAGGYWRPQAVSTENVSSYGILARANGVTSESDGHSTSYFSGADDTGRPYFHTLASNHGRITKNVVSPTQ